MNHLFLTLGWSLVVLGLSACAGMTGERIVYDQQGVQVGIQSDPTISRSSPPARNSHPATLSSERIGSPAEKCFKSVAGVARSWD